MLLRNEMVHNSPFKTDGLVKKSFVQSLRGAKRRSNLINKNRYAFLSFDSPDASLGALVHRNENLWTFYEAIEIGYYYLMWFGYFVYLFLTKVEFNCC